MKRTHTLTLLLLFKFCFTALISHAQWTILDTKLPDVNFTDVYVDGDNIIATGYNNVSYNGDACIAISNDGGLTWNTDLQCIRHDSQVYPQTISFIDKNIGYIGGRTGNGNAFTWKTSDGGLTWNWDMFSVTDIISLYDMTFVTKKTSYSCGSGRNNGTAGVIVKTED